MVTLYEKQMLWRKASQLKAEQTSSRLDAGKDCTFTPTFYTAAPVKPFEGPARELSEASTQRHVNRQASARKEQQLKEDKLYGKSRRQPAMSPKTMVLADVTGREKSSSGAGSEFDSPASDAKNGGGGGGVRLSQHEPLGGDLGELTQDDEMSIVEVLERERRQWHAERIKLIHCIHLQQLELTASSSAAQDRASSIAKEFARAIEGFEERLVNIETNVQKELALVLQLALALKEKEREREP